MICRNSSVLSQRPAVPYVWGSRHGTAYSTGSRRMRHKRPESGGEKSSVSAFLLLCRNHLLRGFPVYTDPVHKNHRDIRFRPLPQHSGNCRRPAVHRIPVHSQAECQCSFQTDGYGAVCHFADQCSITGTGLSETVHKFPV